MLKKYAKSLLQTNHCLRHKVCIHYCVSVSVHNLCIIGNKDESSERAPREKNNTKRENELIKQKKSFTGTMNYYLLEAGATLKCPFSKNKLSGVH